MTSFAMTVISAVIGAATASASAQPHPIEERSQPQPDEQREVHPYFEGVAHYELPEEGEKSVMIDGYLLPKEVHLSCERVGMIEEARLLEFVLVLPQQFELDDFEFDVPRPFYIAKTELSNAQRAELGTVTGSWQGYEAYASIVNLHARAQFDYDAEDLQLIEEYIAEPDYPAVSMGLSEAIASAFRVSRQNNVHVRLPTLAEWYAGMRGGASTRYWWGDTCDFDRIAWEDERRFRESVKSIRSVYEGPENPLGLRNMIGNAAEIAFPTDREREQLLSFATDVVVLDGDGRRIVPRRIVHSQTGFVLGGSVGTAIGMEQEFDRLITSWADFAIKNQIAENGEWLFYYNWCSTARLVIESPPGDFVIEN